MYKKGDAYVLKTKQATHLGEIPIAKYICFHLSLNA